MENAPSVSGAVTAGGHARRQRSIADDDGVLPHLVRRMRVGSALLWLVPVIAFEMLLGARFVVLISLGGVIAMLANRERITRRAVVTIALVIMFLIFSSTLVASSRFEGFANFSSDTYMDYLSQNGVFHSEE
jgi:hypothetical protein